MKLKELFKIVEGSNVYTYTSAKEPETYNGETYEPLPIGRGNAESKTQLERATLDVNLPLHSALGQHYKTSPVDVVVILTIFRQEDGIIGTFWKGRLAKTNVEGAEVKLSFESVFTSLRRPGLRARFQRSCRHVHYGRGCNLNMADYGLLTQLLSVNGASFTVSGVDGSRSYAAGLVRSPGGTLRWVTGQAGTTLTMLRPFTELQQALDAAGYGKAYGQSYGGVSLTIYPGCKHNPDACRTFGSTSDGNIDNYGGFPWIPSGSTLFQGGSVS